ncbi:gonadal somatic cell derived factor [Xiphias gladius]|uniref:gonadal somatic cell derived factor n=1 Tax=Xiphias gladius TaxID=8245 RepID=UPI001A98B4A5|nr:gonadal somatic cell derived factor [Xiphias gladius]
MSFAFIVMTMLLGSSVVIAFVLQPSKEEPATSANSPVSHHRCHGESLQSIRKGLLRALNLQAEPWLPAGGLDTVREQWQMTFSTIAHRAKDTAVAAVSVSPDFENSTSLKCCSMASEIFMRDLGWDNWVIHPASLTIVQCALCNPEVNTVRCPSSHVNVQDADSQVQEPYCQPTSQETVPVVYVDESSTVVISSVQLTRSCGCAPGNIHQPSRE